MSIQNDIQAEFHKKARPQIKAQYEKYFKNAILFYGLRNPEVGTIFKKIFPEIKPLPLGQQIALGMDFLHSHYFEEKLFAILLLQRIGKKLPDDFINTLEKIFPDHVYDWATCDGLSGRVIRYLLPRKGVIARLESWKTSSNNWLQRAAAVSFVNVAKSGEYNDVIVRICEKTIRNPERFVQLGTGWAIRELFLADPDVAVRFIKENYQYFSREGLRYALEKMPTALQQELLNFGAKKDSATKKKKA